jgi:hypothetical protein
MNKNELKYLMILFPFAVLWTAFGIGHALNMNVNCWWGPPYILTSTVALVGSVMITVVIVEKDYHD